MNELIVAENLNPAIVFKDGGIDPILKGIENQVKGLVFDMDTKKGRESCASTAHLVARSKTLLDGMGKAFVADKKKEIKEVDGIRKTARDFLDNLKIEVRAPLTEFERLDKIRQDEEERQEREQVQARVNILQKYNKIMSFVDVALLSDDEYDAILNRAISEYTEKEAREAKEKADREAEDKRLAEQKAEQDRIAKEQAEAAAKLKAEQDKIEADRKAFEDAKKAEAERIEREAFEKQAAEDARIQAEKDARDKIEREAREKIEAEEREAAELERQEAIKPDKEKLLGFMANLFSVPEPELGKEAKVVFDWLEGELIKLDNRLREHLSEL